MRTSYCLAAAAGVTAVALTVHGLFLARGKPKEAPTRPVPADPPPPQPESPPPGELPPTTLPPLAAPPDGSLVIPAAATGLPVPPAEPVAVPLPAVPPSVEPAAPRVELPAVPANPNPLPLAPVPTPVLPQPAPLPVPAPPQLLPPPTPDTTPRPTTSLSPAGRFVVLNGDKLIEGAATVIGDKVVVRQGALDRPFPRADVRFIGESRDDVYRFVLAKVPAGDAAARLSVARWCLLNGLREQALTEAREILKLHPGNTTAAEMTRSLEESLRLFPADGSAPVVAARPQGGTLQAAVEPDPEVSPEAATAFAPRVQPVLANLCMECHARPDHAGAFKLARVTGYEAGPQTTRANLRATASQLKRDDPLNSLLLAKAVVAHGGMRQPAFVSRQTPGFRTLEAWAVLAVGSAVAPVNPMTPPAVPVLPPTPPVTPIPPAVVSVPPPIPVPVSVPAPPPIPTPLVTAPPPVVSVPAASPPPVLLPPALPNVPAVAPSLPPAALPTPPDLRSPVGPAPPPPVIIPPADSPPKAPPPPVVPIPPAAAAPKPPGTVVPAGGSQFGAGVPAKPPATGPTGGDEFDPAGFNTGGK